VTQILGISGSLRRDSHNTNLLRAASEASGLDVELDARGLCKHRRVRAAWAQPELRKVLAALGARVLDVELPVPHAHTRFVAGELSDEEIRAGLADAVAGLAEEFDKANVRRSSPERDGQG